MSLSSLKKTSQESAFIDQYRKGKLSHLALSKALGIDRFQTEELLHRYGVTEDLGEVEDYLRDVETLAKMRMTHRNGSNP